MFFDRKEVGIKLSEALKKYKGTNAIVLAIPRGGVKVGYHLAKELNGDFEILVSKKLGYPFNPDTAFGAVAEEDTVNIFPFVKKELPENIILQIIEQKKAETRQQAQRLRNGRPLTDLKGRVVIIGDDGIATGATIMAAVNFCKKKGAKKIIIAAPICGREVCKKLKEETDEIVVLEIPKQFFWGIKRIYTFSYHD